MQVGNFFDITFDGQSPVTFTCISLREDSAPDAQFMIVEILADGEKVPLF